MPRYDVQGIQAMGVDAAAAPVYRPAPPAAAPVLTNEEPATAFTATADELMREARPVLAAVRARTP